MNSAEQVHDVISCVVVVDMFVVYTNLVANDFILSLQCAQQWVLCIVVCPCICVYVVCLLCGCVCVCGCMSYTCSYVVWGCGCGCIHAAYYVCGGVWRWVSVHMFIHTTLCVCVGG